MIAVYQFQTSATWIHYNGSFTASLKTLEVCDIWKLLTCFRLDFWFLVGFVPLDHQFDLYYSFFATTLKMDLPLSSRTLRNLPSAATENDIVWVVTKAASDRTQRLSLGYLWHGQSSKISVTESRSKNRCRSDSRRY